MYTYAEFMSKHTKQAHARTCRFMIGIPKTDKIRAAIEANVCISSAMSIENNNVSYR